MTITLADITQNQTKAPRIVIYGVPGIGKTTLAAQAPSPVFIPVEDGLGTLDVRAFRTPSSYSETIDAIRSLENQNEYGTVVLDSADRLEPMVWDYVCRKNGKDIIEDFGYGKGYVAAANEWRKMLACFDQLRDRGLASIIIAHSSIVHFTPPDSDPYDRYQMRLHKAADAMLCDWADAVLFINEKVVTVSSGPRDSERKRGISKGERVIYTQERAALRAKNRYGMPPEIPLGDPAETWRVIQSYITQERQEVNSNG